MMPRQITERRLAVNGRIAPFPTSSGPKLGANRAYARARLPTSSSSSGPWVARVKRYLGRHSATAFMHAKSPHFSRAAVTPGPLQHGHR
jgi:hypothetical protein